MIRVSDYHHRFRCLAGACPHSCCEQWQVVLDEATAARYRRVEGDLGARLRSAMEDVDGEISFPLRGGRCPFLNGENLCEIHLCLGEEATSLTCRSHPRFTEEYDGLREVTLAISCPAANALLFSSDAPLTFVEEDDGETPLDDPLFALREELFRLLYADAPLKARLRALLTLGWAAQSLADEGEDDALYTLRYADVLPVEIPDGPPLFPAALEALSELEILGADWAALLTRGKTLSPWDGETHAPALTRLCAYYLFRYVCKAMGDGDILGKIQLAVLAVLTAAHLAPETGLAEAARLFSREIEHSEENLDRLWEGFCFDPRLGPERFFTSLK